jgi:hypothetical protein
MQCDVVSVGLLDSESNQLRLYAQDFPESKGLTREGLSRPVGENSPNLGARWTAQVLRTGQPLNLQGGDLDTLATAEGIRVVCCCP